MFADRKIFLSNFESKKSFRLTARRNNFRKKDYRDKGINQ